MIKKVAGPLVIANIPDCKKGDLVKVGKLRLVGEVIEIRGDLASIQVYEETSGLKVGDPVQNTGMPLSVELGPGLLSTMFDGIQRPLVELEKASGVFIARGVEVPSLNRTKKWTFKPVKNKGDEVSVGDIIGEVEETSLIVHKIMIPHGISGKIEEIKSGSFTIEETIAKISGQEITMLQKWPVRKSRSLKQKESVSIPLTTGQRIIDTMFPLAKGGSACVPGPFGAGKTVIQHQLAKWADADIIVFVGCGERGNEMTDVLQEFPELKDPRTGKPLLERTILIANTSNMPIAAREASVYTGAAIAEYFRDMGYSVALMADSTSRWAEALREMSGRLEEMPGEEGYPAYLSSRLADFYERSGYGKCLGTPEREGSLTIIGSVSPPGGDFSEPVVQNTLRVTKVFWGLDYALAHKRHFPAINWLQSYSLYVENLSKYFKENIGEDFPAIREEALRLLAKEAELEEIVRLVGMESLSQKEQLILFVCKIIREDFLYQSAFDPIDQFSSLKKQYNILSLIMILHKKSLEILDFGVEVKDIQKIDTISRISKLKLTKEEEIPQEAESIRQDMKNKMENLIGRANNE
ncbi:V-type ATP synthase subunit A [candidate division WOR-1 bacterium RIFOXYC2_FULL_37_10]|uniref:V-type ATP synthase alpha chain n=1 Tax=candidate division WOR-1 bacterium RIFOXYB2_FULL_37_13 TaxID=1802579 RepID=A0A1F4SEB0_UNCSA|nr:MAG: V-type ATP synthase subunit A [candidate division WOR-1 bacterium RIFOXYB2_FULL_37_13]OGC32663.1 MAG: V-type ATP synthase subunit A [candidate division WOR-1 bacterium RIFOXYC2_FULL_37_10]